MKMTIGTRIMGGYVAAVILLMANGFVAFRQSRTIQETNDWTAHTQTVLLEMQDILSLVKDAETSQRGFLLTGGDEYLAPFERAEAEHPVRITSLKQLTADNSEQQVRLDRLGQLVNAKFAELLETIDLAQSGDLDAALALVGSGQGRELMVDIRSVVADAMQVETVLLDERKQAAERAYELLIAWLLGGTLAIALVLLGLGTAIVRSITRPLSATVDMIRGMSRGDLGGRLNLDRDDEIGVMATAMDTLADRVETVASRIGAVNEAAVAGDLSVRAEETGLEGDFGRIIQGANRTLDAVVTPTREVAAVLQRIANEEIPQPLTNEFHGEFRVLGDNLNRMITTLREQNRALREGVNVLVSSYNEILATLTQLTSGSAETSAAVSQTSTTVEEVRQTAQVSNDKARAVRDSAVQTATASESGREAVQDSVAGMSDLRDQIEAIAESVVHLSEQSQTIGEIIATVNDLAEQSNLLAVNAAIEATRAGEYGKGFSVVAQEVKSLAEQSRDATRRVRAILTEIQKGTNTAVLATEQGSKVAQKGVDTAEKAGASIDSLSSSVALATQAATQIAASSEQQLVGMDQIASAIASIEQATVQNLAGSEQLQKSVAGLQRLGDKLQGLVERQTLES